MLKWSTGNKGGVTSSSLEVLSGLALTDEVFIDLMTTTDEAEGVSDFYAEYVQEIQRIISINAASFVSLLERSMH
jgi:glutamate dehydrogenase